MFVHAKRPWAGCTKIPVAGSKDNIVQMIHFERFWPLMVFLSWVNLNTAILGFTSLLHKYYFPLHTYFNCCNTSIHFLKSSRSPRWISPLFSQQRVTLTSRPIIHCNEADYHTTRCSHFTLNEAPACQPHHWMGEKPSLMLKVSTKSP